jgi:excisionase family DNA binding protein
MKKDAAVMFMDVDTMPLFFNPRQLADILGICKNKAYKLALSKDFPSMRIGKRIIIHREKFVEWLSENLDN